MTGLFPGFSRAHAPEALPSPPEPISRTRAPVDAPDWLPDALRLDAFVGLLFPARVPPSAWAGSLGGAVSLAWLGRNWRVELGIAGLLAPLRRAPYEIIYESASDPVDVDVAWRLVGSHLRGCHHLSGKRLRLHGCATLESGVLLPVIARSPHIALPERPPSGPWLAVGVGPQIRWQARPRIGVVLGVGGAVDLLPRRFQLDVEDAAPIALDPVPRVALHATVGCEFSWSRR